MENLEIKTPNIAIILLKQEEGTSLWSPKLGKCTLKSVIKSQVVVKHENKCYTFIKNCTQMMEGTDKTTLVSSEDDNPLLFPSESLRDWYSFKRTNNTVLVNINGDHVYFKAWKDDSYLEFIGETIDENGNLTSNSYITKEWLYESRDEVRLPLLKALVNSAYYKDCDILYAKTIPDNKNYIFFINTTNTNKDTIKAYAGMTRDSEEYSILGETTLYKENITVLKYASKSQQAVLNYCLKKLGYKFNTKTKQLVKTEKSVDSNTFKPFEKILGNKKGVWKADFYSHTYKDIIIGVSDSYNKALPYKGNEALLGKSVNNK